MASERAASWRKLFRNRPKFPLRQNRTYIIPTSFGLIFGLLAFTLLLLALGFNNNLLYLFVFLIISTSWTGMILTNQNVNRVEVNRIDIGKVFANETNEIQIHLRNSFSEESRFIKIHGSNKWNDKNPEIIGEVNKVIQDEESLCTCVWVPARRGRYSLPRISLMSSFPFSMLRAWKVFDRKEEVVVFPQRIGSPQFPQDLGLGQERSEAGVFQEMREFRSYDSLRRIDWRSTLRHQKLQVRIFEDESPSTVRVFTWEATAALEDVESRISQLALWVDLAEQQGNLYALALFGKAPILGQGEQHQLQLLTELAFLQPTSAQKMQADL